MKWRTLGTVVAALGVMMSLIYTGTIRPHPSIGTESSSPSSKTIELNGYSINVDVVDTPASREKGLGGRDRLSEDYGMLFVFFKDGTYAFWMKDMRFAIDIVWISASGNVVGISENVTPNTYPATFSPKTPARYVLELPAHAVKRYNVRLGDIVRL